MRKRTWLILLATSAFCATSGAEEPTSSAATESGLKAALGKFCVRCHGADSAKGDLDIETALRTRPLVRQRSLWVNVLERLKGEEMPPEDEAQPTAALRQSMIQWIESSVIHFDYSQVSNPGFEPARRLTHIEYNHTAQQLLGVSTRPADGFPADLSGTSGFDNSANTLFLDAVLLERYLVAASDLVEEALPATAENAADKERRDRILGTDKEETTPAARRILERFAGRAYRRPPTPDEVDELVALYEGGRRAGRDFEGAVKLTLEAILSSPHFLLRVEQRRETADSYPIHDWELASRLSYFLWASMPDDELFELAGNGTLREPEVLAAQVARMVQAPEALTLGEVFAAQWLGYERLGTRVRLDPIDNPWCTDSLMDAMKAESSMYFTSLVRENAPLGQLVDAEYTFLNQELARHYDMDGVEGAEMRRVKLENSVRGGIFGQGSILAVTSFPHRTSPVLRGTWILSEVLGTPPPPPPPDAGEFSRKIRRKRDLTARQKLELHRESKRCAGCHSKIDPLGFSLENFGRFGRWRTSYQGREEDDDEDDGGERRVRDRIDAKGRLPDGFEFEGPRGLRRVILERHMGDLSRQLVQKMLSYALGRQLEYYDEPAVRKVLAQLEEEGATFHTLLHGIVTSYPFQYKKNPPSERKKRRLSL